MHHQVAANLNLRYSGTRTVIWVSRSLVAKPAREGNSSSVARSTKDREGQDEHDEQTATIESGSDEVTVLAEDLGSI